jgi:hypothetical protein
MNYTKHMPIEWNVTFEFQHTCYGSVNRVVLCANQPQTDAPTASGSWVMCSESIAMASTAQASISPLMEWYWTAAISYSSPSKLSKQFERMIVEVQCKKNLEYWLRIDDEIWIWRFLCSWGFERIWWVLDPTLGNVWFCYAYQVIKNIYVALNHA